MKYLVCRLRTTVDVMGKSVAFEDCVGYLCVYDTLEDAEEDAKGECEIMVIDFSGTETDK